MNGRDTCLDFGAPYLTPYGDEGRAMMQIVHDVAPGAKLAFHTAVEGEADFASGIQALATAGAQVIADDVTYYDEPLFQDGLISQAIDTVNSAGVAYFSAAGNDGSNGYDNLAPSFATASTSPAGEKLLNFDTTNATTTIALTVSLPQLSPGEFIGIVLRVGPAVRDRLTEQRRRHESDGSVRHGLGRPGSWRVRSNPRPQRRQQQPRHRS